eukprot:5748519-Karenia_brevis.AAC.1
MLALDQHHKHASSWKDEKSNMHKQHLFDAAVMIVKGNLPLKNINETLNIAAAKFMGAAQFKPT